MTQLTIRLVGLQTLQTGMNKFEHTLAPVSREKIKEALDRARVKTLSGYTQPERGYARTGNLRAGTNVESYGASVRLKSEAYNRYTNYSPYVVGNGYGDGQVGFHAPYWNKALDAVDEQIEILVEGGELEREINKAAKDAGL